MVIEKKKKLSTSNRKIFTCAELERKVVKSPKTSRKIANLKTMDSAVMQFSSNNNVTRYDKAHLMTLKDTKAAKAVPQCLFDPRVIRLEILKSQNQTVDVEKFEEFRTAVNSFDPHLANMLESYHKSLMVQPESFSTHNSSYQNSPVRGNSPNFNRRVSWGDQKIPTYDRKNFFDLLTTTATMRPPRMGVGSLDPQKSRAANSNVRSAKGFACANERFNYYPNNLSAGSISFNETKSSYDGSTDKEKSAFKDDESEPEWFSWPASRHDVIDLHGFDEGDDLQLPEPTARSSDVGTKLTSTSPMKMFDEFARYEERKVEPGPSSYGRRPNNYRLNRSQNSSSSYNGANIQHYRNPFYQSDSSSSTMSSSGNRSDIQNFAHDQHASGREEMAINPFFEMWRTRVQKENVNFLNVMGTNRPQMKTMADIESGMRQNSNPHNFYQAQQQQQQQQQFNAAPPALNPPFNQSVPQFFQNFPNTYLMPGAGVNGNGARNGFYDNATGIVMPTQEQLEQHTSEIMRNAILRKQSQNERKFRK